MLTILNGPIKKISYDYLTDDYGDKIILLFCSHTDYMGSVLLYEQFLHAVSNFVTVLLVYHIEDRDGVQFHESNFLATNEFHERLHDILLYRGHEGSS